MKWKWISVLSRILFLVILSSFTHHILAQEEYEQDLEFETFKSTKKQNFEGKRSLNIHFSFGAGLSTITGLGIATRKDSLNASALRNGFDSYKIRPAFWPQAKVDFSYNFNEYLSLAFGLKYNLASWKERASIRNGNDFFKGVSFYKLHRISTPLGVEYHPTSAVSLLAGLSAAWTIKNEIIEDVLYVNANDTILDYKDVLDFEQTTGLKPRTISPQIYFGGHFGLEKFRIILNFTFTPNFLRNDVEFNHLALDAGILIKLFRDYDNKF